MSEKKAFRTQASIKTSEKNETLVDIGLPHLASDLDLPLEPRKL